jgi:hypothetical protein
MSDYWQQFLELLSDEELIRFERRAQMAGKSELAIEIQARRAEREQREIIFVRVHCNPVRRRCQT